MHWWWKVSWFKMIFCCHVMYAFVIYSVKNLFLLYSWRVIYGYLCIICSYQCNKLFGGILDLPFLFFCLSICHLSSICHPFVRNWGWCLHNTSNCFHPISKLLVICINRPKIFNRIEYKNPIYLNMCIMDEQVTYTFLAFVKSILSESRNIWWVKNPQGDTWHKFWPCLNSNFFYFPDFYSFPNWLRCSLMTVWCLDDNLKFFHQISRL